jgi:hypothetical protein
MMTARLDLTFFPVVGDLIQVSALKSQRVSNAIPDGVVETVVIKLRDLFIITDVPLSVYKNFIIKSIVK